MSCPKPLPDSPTDNFWLFTFPLIVLTLITLIILLGCETQTQKITWATDEEMESTSKEFIYDGCEYVRFIRYNNQLGYMAHKGNCKNPIHGIPESMQYKDEELLKHAVEFKYGECEYVRFTVNQYGYMSHKGDCNNPIHKQSSESQMTLDSLYFDTQSQLEILESLIR